MAASTQCLPDAAVPHVTLPHHLNLVCFIDVMLDFILSLILYRFLLKFLLLLRSKLGAGVLPTAIVFCSATATRCLRNAFTHLPPSSFSPRLVPTSDSVRKFPVTSGSVNAQKFG